VLIENVARLCADGLYEVLADLSAIGFDAEWIAYQALPLVRLKCRIESMLWPTPVHSDTGGPVGLGGGSAARKKLDGMVGEETRRAMCSSGLNPRWTEWLMGFPEGWTDVGSSEMP